MLIRSIICIICSKIIYVTSLGMEKTKKVEFFLINDNKKFEWLKKQVQWPMLA